MERELNEKIEKYVMNAFNAVHVQTTLATAKKLAASRAKLSSTGNLFGSASFWETIDIKSEHIRLLVEAQAKAKMEAYELYGVPLEDSILHDVRQLYEHMLGSTATAMADDPVLNSVGGPEGSQRSALALEQLQRHTSGLMNELTCELERRKIMQKKKPESSTNIEIHGANARTNINSVDNSVNTVTITEQNVFSETRNIIKSDVPEAERAQILDRLAALESSIHKPTAMQRYKEFAASAVEYGKLLSLLPKLLEMVKHLAQSV